MKTTTITVLAFAFSVLVTQLFHTTFYPHKKHSGIEQKSVNIPNLLSQSEDNTCLQWGE